MSNPSLPGSHHLPGSQKTIFLPGAVGQLEAIIAEPNATPKAVGIVCHPHPLYGGTFNNKVVTTIARTWFDSGFAVIRFNFRGVGASEGYYANGSGETDDLFAVIQWAQTTYPQCPIYLAGFSFGAYVALRAVQQHPVAQLVTIAPPRGHFDFSEIKQVPCPWLVIQGDQDELIAAEQVYAWLQQFNPPPQVIRLPKASHFFHGQLHELRSALEKLPLPL